MHLLGSYVSIVDRLRLNRTSIVDGANDPERFGRQGKMVRSPLTVSVVKGVIKSRIWNDWYKKLKLEVFSEYRKNIPRSL